MNIAIISSGFLPVPAVKGGAVENLVENVLKENEIINRKIEFTVFSVYDKEALETSKKYNKTKFEFIKIPKIVQLMDKTIYFLAKNILKKKNMHSYRYIVQRLYYLNKCSYKLNKNNYDKILLENHPTQYLALKWRKNYIKYEGRYYYHCHNEFPGTYGCEHIIKDTKKIICVSNYIKNSIKKYMKMNDDKFEVLINCIDTERFSRKINEEEKNNLLKKYNIEKNKKILLFTGRITPEKGIKELLLALDGVEYTNYKLMILGSSVNQLKVKTKYEEEIEKMVIDRKDKVVFTGFVKYDEIDKYYSLADVAVLPSIWDDPAPLTIIEALVSGLPIITTKSGGIPEYAKNGSAIILERDERLVENISKSIDALLNDNEKIKKMSELSKEVSKDLTIQNFYNNYCNIFEN